MFPSDLVYDDMNVEQLETIPDSAPHRIVDLIIVKADQEGTLLLLILTSQRRLKRSRLCSDLYRTPGDDMGHRFEPTRGGWYPESILSADSQFDPRLRGPASGGHGR